LAERVASLGLSVVEVEDWEEVVDPAAGDQADFDACAATLDDLVGRLVDRLGSAC
jgi:protein-tyrosine-phosphatase